MALELARSSTHKLLSVANQISKRPPLSDLEELSDSETLATEPSEQATLFSDG